MFSFVRLSYSALIKLGVVIAIIATSLVLPVCAAGEDGTPTSAIPTKTNEAILQNVNSLLAYYVQGGKSHGAEWLRTTDINVRFTSDYHPLFSLETIQPLGRMTPQGGLWFAQGRFAYEADAHSTANIGIGWRKLSADKHALFGANTFFDYGFLDSHSRLGVGVESFHRLTEYRANAYLPLSGAREIARTPMPTGVLYTYERAVRGIDLEAGTHFAQAPWLGVFLSGFGYDNQYHDDEVGYRLRTQLQLTPRLSIEAGYSGSNESHQTYGQLTYAFANGFAPSLWGANKHLPNVSTDLTYKMLQKVDRVNTIKTERFTRFVSYKGNIRTSVTNTDGDPVQGVQVQAYQAGQPVGKPAQTDASGIAVITGIDVGSYTVQANYFELSVESDAVTVQREQTAATSMTLPISGGRATVQVVTDDEQPIADATVTAVPTSEERAFGLGTRALFCITVHTGADGIANFANLPPGHYRFVVEYDTRQMASLETVVAPEEETSTLVVLPTVVATGNIAAIVRDTATGELLSGAGVELWNGSTKVAQKTTGNDGMVTFGGLATTMAFTVKASYGNVSVTSEAVTPVEAQTKAAAIALDLRNTATLTVNTGSTPVAGARVSVTVAGQEYVVLTATDGTATFTNMPSGTDTFTVSYAGYDTTTAVLVLAHGQTTTHTVSLVRQLGAVTVTVNDGTTILNGASVTLNGVTQTTDEQGKVTFSNIPTGTYTATAALTNYDGNSASVTITDRQTSTQTISLTRQTGNATLTVTDGTSPLSGATVTLNGASLTSDAQGQVTFTNVPTGTYTATAAKTDYDDNTASVTITDRQTETQTIALVRQRGNATITVTDGTSPLSGATVTLNGSTLTTDSQGQATFNNLPTGAYTATAALANYDANTASVTVTDRQTATAAIVLARHVGAATITVNDGTSVLSGASVTLNGDTKTTDAQGKVSFTNIPTGSYTVNATLTNYDGDSANITISKGQTATQTLSLSRHVGSATITVTNGTAALSGASVTLNGATLTTDAQGRATFSNVPTGSYSASAALSGYDGNTGSVTITKGQTATATIALTRQTGSATITVTDGTAALTGASVTVNGVTKTSDAQGRVSYTGVPTGSYTASAAKTDYDSNTASVTITDGGTATVSIALTRQTGTVTFTITDGTTPLAGASVTLNGATRTSNAQGTVTFTAIPTGSYTATATLTNYDDNSASVTISDRQTTTKTIALARQLGNVTITVNDGTTALSGASVTVNGTTHTTNAQGTVAFNNVPTGTYTVSAALTSYDSNTASITITDRQSTTATVSLTRQTGNATITVTDGILPLLGASVTLNGQTALTSLLGTVTFTNVPTGPYTASATLTNYNGNTASVTISDRQTVTQTIALTRQTGAATITITDGTAPLAGASVTLNGSTRTTDAQGQAAFTNVPTGTYSAVASLTNYDGNSDTIAITNGGTATATIALTRHTGNATVTVTDGTTPLSGASVILNGQTLTTDAQGEAAFTGVPTGTYTASATLAGYDDNTASVTIAKNATATRTIALTRQTGNATVTVNDGTTPISGAAVTLHGQTLTTNAQGQAAFTNLPTGVYTASASAAGYNANTISVTVTSNGTATPSVSLTRQTGEATITVTDGTSPLNSASVTLNGATLTTNAQGQATFTGVPTGSYTATAALSGYDSNTASVTVTYNGSATATIALTRQTGNATLTVTDGTTPLPGAEVTLNGEAKTTDAQGKVSFTNVPTNGYTATATLAGYDANTASVTVTDDQTATATIALTRQTGAVTVTVTDGTDPINGASVTINAQTGTTDAEGKVTIANIPTGGYTATASSTGYTANTGSVTITHGGTATVTIALTRQKGAASITITDGTVALPGAQVTMNGQTVTTDAEGKADYTDVPTGTYTATVTLAGYDNNSAQVTVNNASTATQTIALTRQTGDATITVTDGTSPLTGADVTINGETKTTDAEGKATFTGVPTGDYTATASLTGYTDNSASVTISKGTTATATIALTAQVDIRDAVITVTYDSVPVKGATVYVYKEPEEIPGSTDDNGMCTFHNLQLTTYNIYIYDSEHDEEEDGVHTITVTGTSTARLTVDMKKPIGDADITVTDGTNPVSGASVYIDGKSATTDAEGHATVTRIHVGTKEVQVNHPMYKSSSTETVTITEGGSTAKTIVMQPKTCDTLAIQVLAYGNTSWPGATVTFNGVTKTTNPSGMSYTGSALYTNVPYGTYPMTISAPGFITVNTTLTVDTSGFQLSNIPIYPAP